MNEYIYWLTAACFSVIWLFSIILTVKDKLSSKKNKRRVPEKTLMLLGLFGGAIPMYITMKIIRHKTRHKKFMLGLPAEIIIQTGIIALIFYFKSVG